MEKNMGKDKRIWLDSLRLREEIERVMQDLGLDEFGALTYQLGRLSALVDEGHTLVAAETAIDMGVFVEYAEWFLHWYKEGHFVVEIFNKTGPIGFFHKDNGVEMSSLFGEIIPYCETFEDFLDHISKENREAYMYAWEVLNHVATPRGEWEEGKWEGNTPLTQQEAEELGVSVTATRTEVFAACRQLKKDFGPFNNHYTENLRNQHRCDRTY